MNNLRRVRGYLASVVWLVMSGCSGTPDQPPLGTVVGIVTLGGQPLPSVEISFEPDKGRPSNGKTDSEGKYELTYIRDTKGAKVGSHKVLIRSSRVDHSKLDTVNVVAGPNVIDIACVASSGKQPATAAED